MKKLFALCFVLFAASFQEMKAQSGAALSFDGVDDYVTVGNVLTGSYTKEAWVMITNASLKNHFISGGGTDGQHVFWAPNQYGNRLSAGHNGVWNQVQDPTPLSIGVWYHVAVTYNATTLVMSLYKNGNLVATNNNVMAYTGGTMVRLGAYGNAANLFGGSLDEVRIWNFPRSQAQIQSAMSCPINTVPGALKQYYNFNQGIAAGNNVGQTTLIDVASPAQNGTLVNFALTGSASNFIAPGAVSGPLTVSVTSTSDVSCNGSSDGAATVSASGGTSFTYAWSPSGGTAATASGLTAGTYTCMVTNECGTTSTATVTITQPTPLVVAPSGGGTVCDGQSIALSSNASGGAGGYAYLWSPGFSTSANQVVSPNATTTFTVDVTDNNGCTATGTVNVTVNPTPTISITRNPVNGTVCTGGQATLTASGAQSYSWTGGISNGVPFTPSATTTYTVTGTSAEGCTATAQSTISVLNCGGTTVPCGATITNKNQSLSAASVSGATQYRFRFYDNVTLALVATVTQTSRTLLMNNVPNVFYGNTYRWTVAVNMGAGFGAESSINCTINFAIPSAVLPCGVTYNRYNGYSAVSSVYGSAGYRFTFYDAVTMAQVAQVTQASHYIYFNNVSQLSIGTTYRWTVEVQYNNGSGNVFGPASSANCMVTMAPPTSTVPCNNTYNRQGGYSACTPSQGATGYRFTFYQGAVQVAQYMTFGSPYIYFNQVNGIWNGQTYQWTVEVRYNPGSGNVFGPASTPCNITFSSSARLASPEQSPDPSFSFAMLMYPNPLGEGQNPSVIITGADQKDAVVTVTDLTGRVIVSQMVYCEGNEYTATLTGFRDLVAGMYVMQVQVGDKIESQKFVAE